MKHNWIEPKSDVSVPDDLRKVVGGHPLVAEILYNRGLSTPEAILAFLDPGFYKPSSPFEFPDMAESVDRIWRAIDNQEKILVWGDFDVDGQTSTTLLVEALSDLGAFVDFHIPIRANEGHGIKSEVLTGILSKHPDIGLLLTCDTGIAANEAARYAQQHGVDVIITDHHDLPAELPDAFAIINPKLLPAEHPAFTLPGVGVAYKVVEALLSARERNSCHTEKFLDLVALGIVADVADQIGDTRYLLQLGLVELQRTKRLGLLTLYSNAKVTPSYLNERDIGYRIAPRLNALGRLSNANPIVEFFTTQDPSRAESLTVRLEGLNDRRKLMTDQITRAAITQIEREPALLNLSGLVLAHPDWHTGVIGIVASRLVEIFRKPTILLSIQEDGSAAGSARSIDGVNIINAITDCKDLLTRFGGHPGAAGLSLREEDIPDFRREFGRSIHRQLEQKPILDQLKVTAILPLDQINIDLAEELDRIGPFGGGNPPLIFASHNVTKVSQSKIGQKRQHMRFVISNQENSQHQEVLCWNAERIQLPDEGTPFDLAYKISSGYYKNAKQLQVEYVDHHISDEAYLELATTRDQCEIIDLREIANPRKKLDEIKDTEALQVMEEGFPRINAGGVTRRNLNPGESIVLWTAPPGLRAWQAIKELAPPTIYVFALDPQMDSVESFLQKLTGLVRFAINNKEGIFNVAAASGITAQRSKTVTMGVRWLEAKGFIRVLEQKDDFFILEQADVGEAGIPNQHVLNEVTKELISLLTETAAFRSYFRATKQGLFD